MELAPGAVIALTGGLGAGKTTLAKAIAAGLNVAEPVTSPTFTLINEYVSGRLPLYHFDVYRLGPQESRPEEPEVRDELAEIGYEEYFFGKGVTIVEWADLIRGLLPENTFWIELSHTEDPYVRRCETRGAFDNLSGSDFGQDGAGKEDKSGRTPVLPADDCAERDGIDAADSIDTGKQSCAILAIETTGPICSVALRTNDGRVFYRAGDEGLMHLTSLLPMVRDVLSEAGMAPKYLERIAVSAGPGSFTGIRIGVATARALAQTLCVPVVKVPTLETFVYLTGAMDGERRPYTVACPVFDARRSQIYAGAYMLEADGRIMTLVRGGAYEPCEYIEALEASMAALARLAARADGVETAVSCLLMGDGALAYPEVSGFFAKGFLGQAGSSRYIIPEENEQLTVQDARAVLAWALAHGVPACYEKLEPVYMRKAEAQRKLDEKTMGTAGSPAICGVSIGVRPATEDDVYGISVIERLSFGEPWLERSIRDDINLEYSDYVVCESEGLILGYAGLHRILDEGHITNIAVHPSVREHGVGSAALRELVRRAEGFGAKDFTLEVRSGDEAAIRFYQNHGFAAEGFRKGYYPVDGGGREDALIMWRRAEPQPDSVRAETGDMR